MSLKKGFEFRIMAQDTKPSKKKNSDWSAQYPQGRRQTIVEEEEYTDRNDKKKTFSNRCQVKALSFRQ